MILGVVVVYRCMVGVGGCLRRRRALCRGLRALLLRLCEEHLLQTGGLLELLSWGHRFGAVAALGPSLVGWVAAPQLGLCPGEVVPRPGTPPG